VPYEQKRVSFSGSVLRSRPCYQLLSPLVFRGTYYCGRPWDRPQGRNEDKGEAYHGDDRCYTWISRPLSVSGRRGGPLWRGI